MPKAAKGAMPKASIYSHSIFIYLCSLSGKHWLRLISSFRVLFMMSTFFIFESIFQSIFQMSQVNISSILLLACFFFRSEIFKLAEDFPS